MSFWACMYLDIFDKNLHFLCKKLRFWSNISKYRLKNSKWGKLKPRWYSIINSNKISKVLVLQLQVNSSLYIGQKSIKTNSVHCWLHAKSRDHDFWGFLLVTNSVAKYVGLHNTIAEFQSFLKFFAPNMIYFHTRDRPKIILALGVPLRGLLSASA